MIKKYCCTKLIYNIYDIFPPYYPNRPIFNPQTRWRFGTKDETNRAEIILDVAREEINWSNYSKINEEAATFISMFSVDFYKYAFPSLLCFCISSKSILPSGGLNIVANFFVDNHLNVDNVHEDWELDFLLSLNYAQSNAVANVLKILNENRMLEKYWGEYLV